ncbi:hypothetical protein [Butyricicoccus sp.]|uniref:hypothetical protein n=1 Tax=Butyricicoccus sp. TaxID=2049021 RepID=UPI003D7E869F
MMFLTGMAVGAAFVTAVQYMFVAYCDKKDSKKKHRTKRGVTCTVQQTQRGFCGDIYKDNSWMKESAR